MVRHVHHVSTTCTHTHTHSTHTCTHRDTFLLASFPSLARCEGTVPCWALSAARSPCSLCAPFSFDEFKAVAADFIPASFISGNFPLAIQPSPPRSCPPSGTFLVQLTLPHYYGSDVNVSLRSVPDGLISTADGATSIYWNTSATGAQRKGSQNLNIACSPVLESSRVNFALAPGSDNFHYSLGTMRAAVSRVTQRVFSMSFADASCLSFFFSDSSSIGFTVSRDLPPAFLRVNMTSDLLRLRNGTVLDPSSRLIQFDGYSGYLDLNAASDTGVQPQLPGNLNIPEYLQSPDSMGLLEPGWTADGWWQALSLAHPATLFACGEKPASSDYTFWQWTSRESNALRSISVQLSVTHTNQQGVR